ncbi:MAG: mannose-1-phosphate guanylyltransferase/mannose-6-phosphate isomerase [Alteromonadaceae bacterium]|nr:MAG: mannose-1-phosphate guanylyltransferase/mannose-6-phosphate isomerase [Alteromonadaceae bacterium]
MPNAVPTVIPVILSGGSGTRLWPKSRKAYPKQLHKLYGNVSMLQHTVQRVSKYGAPVVVCNESQRFMVADQLSDVCVQKPKILLEPAARNTAPAIAVAALEVFEADESAVIAVLAADHLIKDVEAFQASLDIAVMQASQGKLVAFGVVPTHPETGYGYINSEVGGDSALGGKVNKFVEKPDAPTAQEYLDSGNYYWNSGMFVFSARQYLEELALYEPEMLEHCRQSLSNATKDLDFVRLEEKSFSACKDISVDYALMERTGSAWCVPLSAGWSDLGSWQSLWEASEKDAQGNVSIGDVLIDDCEGSLFHSETRLIAGIGLKDIVVVDTDDAILVVDKNQTQKVKAVVDRLKANDRTEFNHHRKVHRPWGNYDSIDHGDRYQVKCIEVKPGASLSLQMHYHRAEHWIVVSGTALVQRGEEEILLSENQSIYIPLGEKHRLTNPGKFMLQLIEVQSGSYLGEDDIVRFEDKFGRT